MQSSEVSPQPPTPASHLERFLLFYFLHPAFDHVDDPWVRFVALPSALRKEKAEARKREKKKELSSFPLEGTILRSELEAKLASIQQMNQRGLYDCYYIANLVRGDLGTKRCENVDVTRRLYLPLDIDFRLPCSVGEMLSEFGLPASAVIQTSMRAQYPRYQILFSLDGEELRAREETEALAQRMCQVFGSDAVHDAKRILRLPGTINWKRAESSNGTVPMVTWCKVIDGLGGLVPENVWCVEEIAERVEEFAKSALSAELVKLSREHSMTKEAVASVKKKSKTKKATNEKDGAEFGWWQDVLERAEKGKASVRAGARHPAMVSWMGQMLRGGIVLASVVSNLRLLAERACEPSFLSEEDFGRMLSYVAKYREKLDDEQSREFLRDEPVGRSEVCGVDDDASAETGTAKAELATEPARDDGSGETDPASTATTGEEPATPSGTANVEQGEAEIQSSGVASTLKDLEEREQVAILHFRERFFDWLFAKESLESRRYEKELAMLIVAVQHWRMMKDETLFIDFFEGAFRRVNCFIGNWCSARADVITPWGARAVSRAPMSEAELLAVVDSCVRKLGRGLKQFGEKLAALPSVQAALGEELTDKEQRKVSLRLTGTTRLVSSIASGMSRRLGGSFGKLDTQPPRIIVPQNGKRTETGFMFDVEGKTPAALRYSNPVQTRYVEDSPSPDGAWNRFLERAFPGDEGTKELIYRIIGYMMTTDTSAQKIFWFEGVSGSGKSSLAGVILAILGQHNICTARMQTIAGDFGLSMCEGKLLCLIEEAENADPKIRNNAFGRLKEAASGNPITIQQKFRDERSVRLVTKFLLLSNKDLGLDDSGGGTLRRLVPIKFEHVVPADQVKPDWQLRSEMLAEADAIASEAVRRWAAVWNQPGTAFDVRESIALSRGREDTRMQLAGVSTILEEILEPCAVDLIGYVPLPSTLIKEVLVAVAAERGVTSGLGRSDKIMKDVRSCLDRMGAVHSERSRPSGHNSKYFNGYSGVRFKADVWERGLAWGKILSEISGHARFAAELLCKANAVSDAEIDGSSLAEVPEGVLE